MRKLRGVYNSGIVVEIKYDDFEDYTTELINDLFARFITDLSYNRFNDNDYLVSASWIKEGEKHESN